MSESDNLHPVAHRTVGREERESAQGHLCGVFWLTGLSGSGKSTVAIAAERRLFAEGMRVRILDGDDVRTGLNAGLTFSLADRAENIRRIAHVAKLFADTGFVVLCSFVSPTRAMRASAKTIIGAPDFHEIYVAADLATCEARDVKGLYAKARAGEIKGFTGIDSVYEAPEAADLTLETRLFTAQHSADQLVEFIKSWSER